MMRRLSTWVFVISATLWSLQVDASMPKHVHKDKQGLCKRYGIACPVGKMCMVQDMKWPLKMKLPICVKEKFVPAHFKACYKPPEKGPCAAEFIRWYYNAQADQCSWFYYGGCHGNRNKFFSQRLCERSCMGDRYESNSGNDELAREVTFDRGEEPSDRLDKESERRAREFQLRPTPQFQELRSKIETTVLRHEQDGSRKWKSKGKKNGKKHKRLGNSRHHKRVHNSEDLTDNRHYRRGDSQWPNAYRKTMRRGELFKLFSVLNHRDENQT